MRLWFQCKHEEVSNPVTQQRSGDSINRLQDSYVTCQKCGQRLPFHLAEGRTLAERRKFDDSALTPAMSAAEAKDTAARASAALPPTDAAAEEDDVWGHTGARENSDIAQAHRTDSAQAGPRVPATPLSTGTPAPRSGSALSITGLHRLALTYHTKGKLAQAERVYGEALMRMSTPEERQTPEYSQVLNNVGRLYHEQHRYESAEVFYRRSLEAVIELYGPNHPKTLRRLNNIAELLAETGRESDAEFTYREAVDVAEQSVGIMHPDAAKIARGLAALLRRMGHGAEAAALEKRAGVTQTDEDLRNAAGV